MQPTGIRTVPRSTSASGFSLVELMVTLAVAAVLLGLAAPSFSSMLVSNRLTSQTNELVGALQIARSEAVRNNTRAIVCRSSDQSTCEDGAKWSGWVVGLDTDKDGQIDKVLKVGSVKPSVTVIASSNVVASRVIFRPNGFAHMADGSLLEASLGVCVPATTPKLNVRAVSIAAGSRIASKPLDGAGTCPAAANKP